MIPVMIESNIAKNVVILNSFSSSRFRSSKELFLRFTFSPDGHRNYLTKYRMDNEYRCLMISAKYSWEFFV